jgi:hypothetical protein
MSQPSIFDDNGNTSLCDLPRDHPNYDPFETITLADFLAPKESRKRAAEESMPDAQGAYDAFAKAPVKKVKMKRDSAQFSRAISYLHGLFPDVPMTAWEKTEHNETLYSGMQLKRDLWGFADVLGQRAVNLHDSFGNPATACQNIACQITTVDQIAPHIRKYTDATTKSLNEVPTLTKLRHFLDCGNILIILGYEKIGARWVGKHTTVTHEMLDKAIQRKR